MSETLTEVRREIGGKGARLEELARDHRVPPFFCVDASDFRRMLEGADVVDALREARAIVDQDGAAGAARVAEVMQSAVRQAPLPAGVVTQLVRRYTELASPLVAVRSSAVGEDGGEHSFAGQFDSVLGVRDRDQLVDAVRRCWASAFNDRAIAYRIQHGLDPLDVAMGVVVQHLIDSEVAGVLFTGDPVTGDPDTVVVSATYGLGEALVSGIANADTFRVDRATGEITAEVADKDIRIVLGSDELTREEPVPQELRGQRCLTDEQVRELAELGLALERESGSPQDVEWAFAGGRLYVLQARPITSPLRRRGLLRVWDNSNIVESYAGVVSPLTFSFAREAYGAVYLQYAKLMRVPRSELPRAQVVFRQMLGYLDGRVYYNLRSWYYLISILPNYEENKGAMEQMMGVREGLDDTLAPPASRRRKLQVTLGTLWNLVTIKGAIRRFRDNLFATLDRHDHDFDELSADELVDAYDQLKLNLLNNWQAPLVNDFRVMVFFNKLRKQIDEWKLDDTGTLANDLLCGQGDVESAEPTYMLMRMAERIRREPALRRLVLETDDARLIGAIESDGSETSRWILEQYELYLRRFGDRCANELKLETPTLRENPAFLFSVLRNYVRQDDLTLDSLLERERAVRMRAEQQVRERIGGGIRGRIRQRVFFLLLGWARSAVRDREALRFDRTRVFGLARRILAAIGERMHESGLLDEPRDVFFLEVDEVVGTVQGTCTTTDLRALVAIRKAACERWEQHELPDRIETRGITTGNPLEDAYAATDTSGDSLTGIAACPGAVERTARVVLSPDQGVRLDGDIMVCQRTDPGWVPLFPSCGGLLVERGSLLSHSAIVAREFGIPAIVGIAGLMQWARDGEQLRMDGSTGVISRGGDAVPPQEAE